MHENTMKKIPGEIQSMRSDSQGYVDNLENKTIIELQDILKRQNKLIANKYFVLKLPDRGEKIVKFRDKVQNEITHRDEIEKAANLLSRLNIVSEGKNAINELEWTGKYNEKFPSQIVELDIDDETDPLKILAQPTGSGAHKKKIFHLESEESLITPEDLIAIQSSMNENPLVLEHVQYIIDKVENDSVSKINEKEKFKPYKTTVSDVHDPMKEKVRKKHNHWEITAATPPLIVHGAAKILTLNESIKLQLEQREKLKQVQARYAIEKLTVNINLHNLGTIPSDTGSYRTPDHGNESNSENEGEEVYDDDTDDKAGTVVFPIDSLDI